MGGCRNYGPVLGTLNIRGRIIVGIQKGPQLSQQRMLIKTWEVAG